jgi:acetylornithine deacetylase
MRAHPPLREMLKGLIETPSVSCVNAELDMPNRPVIDLLAGWLTDLGFRAEIMPLAPDGGKANLIATLGGGPAGLVLAGHTDTVPCDERGWSHDPFRLTEADGRLYGLGTSDMKGFFALALEAVRDLKAGHLRQPLILLATADEETGMSGAKALQAMGRRLGRHAVIGEPTGMRPVRMHKGIMAESIRVLGRSGHSSDPSLGANAIEGMHRVIEAVLTWRSELQEQYREPRFSVPVPTLNLGHIHGGDSPNRICGACELHLDLRTLPGMDIQALRATLQARVSRALEGTRQHAEFASLFDDGMPALETPEGAPIVQAAEALTGQPAGAVAFGTEGPYLSGLGVQVLVLGPGDIAQAHQPDEYLRVERLEPMVNLLQRIIDRFCVQAES